MSSDALDVAAYYLQYKLTVYDNLFVGIVYGEGQDTLLPQLLTHCTLPRRGLYRALRHLGLHPPVSFVFTFERKSMHAERLMAFRSKPGFTSSPPRMFMFGVTTFMFVLGIIALVLETAFGFQQMQLFLDLTAGNVWSSARTNVIIAVGATITRLMVRPAQRLYAV